MEAGREGKRGERGCLACEQSLLLPGLRGGLGFGGALRDPARRLDPGRILLLSSTFFLFTFMKFLTQNKHF